MEEYTIKIKDVDALVVMADKVELSQDGASLELFKDTLVLPANINAPVSKTFNTCGFFVDLEYFYIAAKLVTNETIAQGDNQDE